MSTKQTFVVTALAGPTLLSACMSAGPARIPSSPEAPSEGHETAALWKQSETAIFLDTLPNVAIVVKVDGHEIDWQHQWIQLAPGRHQAQIEHRRFAFTCALHPVGCFPFLLGRHELEFDADAGRSYVPFTLRYCGKDWIWIEDIGSSAFHDIEIQTKMGLAPAEFRQVVHRPGSIPTTRVVAGQRPSSGCNLDDNDTLPPKPER